MIYPKGQESGRGSRTVDVVLRVRKDRKFTGSLTVTATCSAIDELPWELWRRIWEEQAGGTPVTDDEVIIITTDYDNYRYDFDMEEETTDTPTSANMNSTVTVGVSRPRFKISMQTNTMVSLGKGNDSEEAKIILQRDIGPGESKNLGETTESEMSQVAIETLVYPGLLFDDDFKQDIYDRLPESLPTLRRPLVDAEYTRRTGKPTEDNNREELSEEIRTMEVFPDWLPGGTVVASSKLNSGEGSLLVSPGSTSSAGSSGSLLNSGPTAN